MNTHTPLSIAYRNRLVPVVSALLVFSLLVEIAIMPNTTHQAHASRAYASNVDILIIDDDTYYLDENPNNTLDDYTHYNEYNNQRPYDMYEDHRNPYWDDPVGDVFDIIEQNLMLDNSDDDDGIYFQDGFQTI